MELTQKKSLNTFKLVMIAIVSVDSLRNLPIGAQYGLPLVTFYLFAGLGFFLPLAWVSSRLAVRFPKVGGSYVWIEAAFGKKLGYLSIWLQWTYNMIWYPTIFAFISSTVASLVAPQLESNKWFILMSCASLFWLITLIHSRGVRASSWLSTISALIGTLLPMALIIGFAAYWLATGSPSATPLTLMNLIPTQDTFNDLGYFSNILFSLLGLEVIAMHAGNVANAQSVYPRALAISAVTIITTLILSSLALCIIIPPGKISLIGGIMDVFNAFFSAYHLPFASTLIGWCIVIGGVGIASSWMIGLARGLHTALVSTNTSETLQKLNKNGVPMNVLIFQGFIYTLLLSAFLMLSNVNQSYWLLSALTAQFSLLYYVLLFAAALKLFRAEQRGWLLPTSGGLISVIGIIVGFMPPASMRDDHLLQYELFMMLSLVAFCAIPYLVLRWKSRKLSEEIA